MIIFGNKYLKKYGWIKERYIIGPDKWKSVITGKILSKNEAIKYQQAVLIVAQKLSDSIDADLLKSYEDIYK